MTMKFPKTILLLAIVIGGLALAAAPFTLGNVFQFGSSTAASMPTFADGGGILGGAIFNLDAGRLYVNDGTTWQRVPFLLSDGGIN